MCVPVPATLAAPGSQGPLVPLPATGWPGRSGQGRRARTPPAPESSRQLGPHPRRDGTGVAGAHHAITAGRAGVAGAAGPPPAPGWRRPERVRRARTPLAPGPLGPSPAPGWPGRQCSRREEGAVRESPASGFASLRVDG
ncbi:uncharacterized protein [Miscanthus floridulus]|uniref:uncharacterized protein n=1 Tax=Miscanthus floridulus TaxID=154761 RepID=UPI00345A49A8